MANLANVTKIDSRSLVVVHNDIVEAKYRLTEQETKFIESVLSLVKKDDTELHKYKIPVKEFFDVGAITDDNYKMLTEFATSLFKKPLHIEDKRERDLEKRKFIVFSWFSSIEYKDGYFYVKLNETLKDKFLKLDKNFTSSELINTIKVGGAYNSRIYKLCKQYLSAGQRIMEIEHLMLILDVPKSFKEKYNNFKQKVLDVAVREIRLHSDIEISYKPHKKEGKKIISLKFDIKNNEFKEQDFSIYNNRRIKIKDNIKIIDNITKDKGYINILYKTSEVINGKDTIIKKTHSFQEIEEFFTAMDEANKTLPTM